MLWLKKGRGEESGLNPAESLVWHSWVRNYTLLYFNVLLNLNKDPPWLNMAIWISTLTLSEFNLTKAVHGMITIPVPGGSEFRLSCDSTVQPLISSRVGVSREKHFKGMNPLKLSHSAPKNLEEHIFWRTPKHQPDECHGYFAWKIMEHIHSHHVPKIKKQKPGSQLAQHGATHVGRTAFRLLDVLPSESHSQRLGAFREQLAKLDEKAGENFSAPTHLWAPVGKAFFFAL